MIRVFLLLMALAGPVWAVQPDEILADPALEARAREISRQVRCPVCQGESIDDSHAQISRDLRLIIRERLVAGDSDADVLAFLVARYGEFVLFDPPKSGMNLILWLAGPAMLLAGGAIALTAMRRQGETASDALSAEEQARLDAIMKK
jgi:cytochrome c-type biogenesis protein CcmH